MTQSAEAGMTLALFNPNYSRKYKNSTYHIVTMKFVSIKPLLNFDKSKISTR